MAFEAITTQEELDRIISARLNREQVKAQEALDALKLEHNKALEALKTSHSSELEDLRKSTAEELAAAKADAEKSSLASLRLSTAAEHGVPAELLSGATAEELKASAEKLLDFQRGATTHGPATGLENINQGDDRDQEARAIFGL